MEVSVLQKMVDETMDYFDFEKVAKVMAFLGWEVYYDGKHEVPDVFTLRKMARRDIYASITDFEGCDSDEYYTRCGPFAITLAKENDKICYLELQFVVAHWDTTPYEFE